MAPALGARVGMALVAMRIRGPRSRPSLALRRPGGVALMLGVGPGRPDIRALDDALLRGPRALLRGRARRLGLALAGSLALGGFRGLAALSPPLGAALLGLVLAVPFLAGGAVAGRGRGRSG
jgi:hypothetical protein